MIGKRVYALLLVLLVMVTAQAWGAIEGGRYRNKMYIVETEGLRHSFSVQVYKTTDDGTSQVKVENADLSGILPVYSTKKDVGTDFNTEAEAKQAAKQVFGEQAIRQIISNFYGVAKANHIDVVNVSFLYDCNLKGKPISVLLFFSMNLNEQSTLAQALSYTPSTSGYLIVNRRPVWVQVSYTSRHLSEEMRKMDDYATIEKKMQDAGVLGRLIITEMNLDGSVAETLLDTVVTDDRFEMPSSSGYVPQKYITAIIDAYKGTIQSVSPLYIQVNYIGSPTVAVDKNGNPFMTINVTKKTLGVRNNTGGMVCWPHPYYGSCTHYIVNDYQDEYIRNYIYYMCAQFKKGKLSFVTKYYGLCGKHYCYKWFPSEVFTSCNGNPENHCCSEWGPKIYPVTTPRGVNEPMAHVGNINLPFLIGDGHKVYIGDGKIKFDNSNAAYIYGKSSTSFQLNRWVKFTLETNNGNIRLCNGEGRFKTCSKWIQADDSAFAFYSTTYTIAYTVGGNMMTYQVYEPLTKVALPDGSYYYAMRAVRVVTVEFNSKSGSTLAGGYTTTKKATGDSFNWLVNQLKNKNEQQIRSILKYLIVDPFGTGKIIDVRNDTVNGLDESDYRNWDIPVTFVMQ